jgi:hypothetical protein
MSLSPSFAAATPEPVPSALGPSAAEPSDPATALPIEQAPRLDPSLPREPEPTGIELPDELTARELKGQYALGLGLLILGGIVTAGVLLALFLLLVQRTWSRQA